jgi:hypothetical protein
MYWPKGWWEGKFPASRNDSAEKKVDQNRAKKSPAKYTSFLKYEF